MEEKEAVEPSFMSLKRLSFKPRTALASLLIIPILALLVGIFANSLQPVKAEEDFKLNLEVHSWLPIVSLARSSTSRPILGVNFISSAEAPADETADVEAKENSMVEEVLEEAEDKKKKKKKSKDEEKPEEPKGEEAIKREADTSKMYEGEIELTIVPPVGLALLSEIHNELDKIPEAKVLQTVGSWDKSTSIKVLLEKPMPLAQILTRIPGVEMVQEMTEKGDYKSSTIKNMGKQGIEKYIALRTSSGTV